MLFLLCITSQTKNILKQKKKFKAHIKINEPIEIIGSFLKFQQHLSDMFF
jgi:hypothetical protein